jgi:HD superfamily phosphohydrolase
MGMSYLVYPGAHHTRFHHAIGAMHIMQKAVEVLRFKEVLISKEVENALYIAILLHDIGHGPFSHVLEYTLLNEVKHEDVSTLLMAKLNQHFKGRLNLAIDIFENKYSRKFFHQLVSSQLDVDRLDYLSRDSFYTGVREGFIGSERLLSMMDLNNEQLVIEEKGIYSTENFLMARRLMYWQVYLHKTAIAAETMLIQILRRAKFLFSEGQKLTCSGPLKTFLKQTHTWEEFSTKENLLIAFTELDDHDVWAAIKEWKNSSDKILRHLCTHFLARKLFTCKLGSQPIPKAKRLENRVQVMDSCESSIFRTKSIAFVFEGPFLSFFLSFLFLTSCAI